MRRNWFYRHAGHVHGPVTIRDLRAAVLLGFVSPDDLVRERVLGDWMPAREVPELHEVARLQPGEESGTNRSGLPLVESNIIRSPENRGPPQSASGFPEAGPG